MSGHAISNDEFVICVDKWDASYLRRPGSQPHYFFLTHLHADHIKGLTSSWSRLIYTSPFNAWLLPMRRNVRPHLLKELELNVTHTIRKPTVGAAFQVTLLDANHCPGAVMFLFQGSFGNILYTGDFRYSPGIPSNPVLSSVILNEEIDTLYLDNTYAAVCCNFPSREEALEQVLKIVEQHPEHKILVGMRQLGKEEVLRAVALHVNERVCVSPQRLQILKKLEYEDVFTTETSQSRIHAVELHTITRRHCQESSNVISIKLTSMYESGDFNRQRGNVFVVPYSDHSCHVELKEFVMAIRPRLIVPIVTPKEPSLDAASTFFTRMSSVNCVIPEDIHQLCSSSIKILPSLETSSRESALTIKFHPCPKQRNPENKAGVVHHIDEGGNVVSLDASGPHLTLNNKARKHIKASWTRLAPKILTPKGISFYETTPDKCDLSEKDALGSLPSDQRQLQNFKDKRETNATPAPVRTNESDDDSSITEVPLSDDDDDLDMPYSAKDLRRRMLLSSSVVMTNGVEGNGSNKESRNSLKQTNDVRSDKLKSPGSFPKQATAVSEQKDVSCAITKRITRGTAMDKSNTVPATKSPISPVAPVEVRVHSSPKLTRRSLKQTYGQDASIDTLPEELLLSSDSKESICKNSSSKISDSTETLLKSYSRESLNRKVDMKRVSTRQTGSRESSLRRAESKESILKEADRRESLVRKSARKCLVLDSKESHESQSRKSGSPKDSVIKKSDDQESLAKTPRKIQVPVKGKDSREKSHKKTESSRSSPHSSERTAVMPISVQSSKQREEHEEGIQQLRPSPSDLNSNIRNGSLISHALNGINVQKPGRRRLTYDWNAAQEIVRKETEQALKALESLKEMKGFKTRAGVNRAGLPIRRLSTESVPHTPQNAVVFPSPVKQPQRRARTKSVLNSMASKFQEGSTNLTLSVLQKKSTSVPKSSVPLKETASGSATVIACAGSKKSSRDSVSPGQSHSGAISDVVDETQISKHEARIEKHVSKMSLDSGEKTVKILPKENTRLNGCDQINEIHEKSKQYGNSPEPVKFVSKSPHKTCHAQEEISNMGRERKEVPDKTKGNMLPPAERKQVICLSDEAVSSPNLPSGEENSCRELFLSDKDLLPSCAENVKRKLLTIPRKVSVQQNSLNVGLMRLKVDFAMNSIRKGKRSSLPTRLSALRSLGSASNLAQGNSNSLQSKAKVQDWKNKISLTLTKSPQRRFKLRYSNKLRHSGRLSLSGMSRKVIAPNLSVGYQGDVEDLDGSKKSECAVSPAEGNLFEGNSDYFADVESVYERTQEEAKASVNDSIATSPVPGRESTEPKGSNSKERSSPATAVQKAALVSSTEEANDTPVVLKKVEKLRRSRRLQRTTKYKLLKKAPRASPKNATGKSNGKVPSNNLSEYASNKVTSEAKPLESSSNGGIDVSTSNSPGNGVVKQSCDTPQNGNNDVVATGTNSLESSSGTSKISGHKNPSSKNLLNLMTDTFKKKVSVDKPSATDSILSSMADNFNKLEGKLQVSPSLSIQLMSASEVSNPPSKKSDKCDGKLQNIPISDVDQETSVSEVKDSQILIEWDSKAKSRLHKLANVKTPDSLSIQLLPGNTPGGVGRKQPSPPSVTISPEVIDLTESPRTAAFRTLSSGGKTFNLLGGKEKSMIKPVQSQMQSFPQSVWTENRESGQSSSNVININIETQEVDPQVPHCPIHCICGESGKPDVCVGTLQKMREDDSDSLYEVPLSPEDFESSGAMIALGKSWVESCFDNAKDREEFFQSHEGCLQMLTNRSRCGTRSVPTSQVGTGSPVLRISQVSQDSLPCGQRFPISSGAGVLVSSPECNSQQITVPAEEKKPQKRSSTDSERSESLLREIAKKIREYNDQQAKRSTRRISIESLSSARSAKVRDSSVKQTPTASKRASVRSSGNETRDKKAKSRTTKRPASSPKRTSPSSSDASETKKPRLTELEMLSASGSLNKKRYRLSVRRSLDHLMTRQKLRSEKRVKK